jgi:hypothetical protein
MDFDRVGSSATFSKVDVSLTKTGSEITGSRVASFIKTGSLIGSIVLMRDSSLTKTGSSLTKTISSLTKTGSSLTKTGSSLTNTGESASKEESTVAKSSFTVSGS